MNFEHELRDRLHREAASVALPGRDPASAARRSVALRRRRQLGAAAMVAVSAATILGVPLLLASEDSGTSNVEVGTAGLPATGPINFDFQSSGQGLLWPDAFFQAPGGAVYALSTEPGRAAGDMNATPRAVYQLAEDGTWQPLLLGELKAVDLAGGDGLLYAVSTGPGEGSQSVAYLSTSSDGGATWSSEAVDPPTLPNDEISWLPDTRVSIETSGDTTLALVTNSFWPESEALFPEMQGPDADQYFTNVDENGVSLMKMELEELDAETGVSPAADGAADPAAAAEEALASAEEEMRILEDEQVVRTIPWSELGIDGGLSALTQRELYRRTGDSWERLDANFGDVSGAELGRAGGRFTVVGWNADGTKSSMSISDDGTEWSAVEAPSFGRIVGVGDALVNVPSFDFGAPDGADQVIEYSLDGGGTWTEIKLTDLGVEPGWIAYDADGGPLGLGLTVGPASDEDTNGGPQRLLFSGDLMDWTSSDLAELTGIGDISGTRLLVGEDRVVINVETYHMSQTATVVGTPVR